MGGEGRDERPYEDRAALDDGEPVDDKGGEEEGAPEAPSLRAGPDEPEEVLHGPRAEGRDPEPADVLAVGPEAVDGPRHRSHPVDGPYRDGRADGAGSPGEGG